MKQKLLDDLQRLLKCPIPKEQYAGGAAVAAWYYEAVALRERIKSGKPINIQWVTRPINVFLLNDGDAMPESGQFGRFNFMRYPLQFYDAAIAFRYFVFAIVVYHSNNNPTEDDIAAYELALREMEEIWVPYNERSSKG